MATRGGRSWLTFLLSATLLALVLAGAAPGSTSAAHTPVGALSGSDTLPPTTLVSLSGPSGYNGWYKGPLTIWLNATDDGTVAGTFVQLDDGSWSSYTGPFEVTADGYHILRFYSTDTAGNNESIREVDFAIDSLAPGTSVTVLGRWNATLLEYEGPVSLLLCANDSGSGVGTIRVQVDRGPWSTYADPVNLSSTGIHIVNYSAEDVAGNLEPVGGVLVPVGISYAGPVAFATLNGTTGLAGWYVSTVRAGLRAVSLPGVAVAATYRIDAGPWETYDGSVLVGDGRHLLSVSAIDGLNRTMPSATLAVQVDQVPPMTGRILNGTIGKDGLYLSNVTVRLVAMDATSGVASTLYAVDSGAWQSYRGPFTLGDGRHAVMYRSVDEAGNQEATQSFSIEVDTLAPQIIDLAPSGIVSRSMVDLSWTATDPGAGPLVYAISVDGGAFAPIGPETHASLSFADGDHYVVVRATNAAGLSTVAVIAFRVDTNPFSPTGPLSGVPLYLMALTGIGLLGGVGAARQRRRVARSRASRGARAAPRPAVHPVPRSTRQVRYRTLAADPYVPVRPQPFRPPGTRASTASRRR